MKGERFFEEAPVSTGFLHRYFRLRKRWAARWRDWREGWRVFSQNRLAMLGLFLLLMFTVMAFLHPVLMETVWINRIYNPQTGYDMDILIHPSPPSPRHWLGTDALGRDVLSMLLYATTPTYILAMTAALITAAVSTVIGAISAYYRGLVDSIFTHLADVFLLAPAPLVMVVIGGTLSISPASFGALFGLIAGLGGSAVVMRAYALTLMQRSYIDAARVAGAGSRRIILTHLIPHMLPLAAVQTMLTVTGAIFADGFTAFLGLSRTRLNWGSLIYSSFTNQAISTTITWNVLIPAALSISLFAASFYLIARGLHEVAEPRLRRHS